MSLVTALPGGKPAVGQLADTPDGNAFGAVSADGSRVFFTANGDLYVRENGKSTCRSTLPCPELRAPAAVASSWGRAPTARRCSSWTTPPLG